MISRNARAQTQLIEDLLDMSRIISGKLPRSIRPRAATRISPSHHRVSHLKAYGHPSKSRDGGLPFGAVGEATVAHLYNTSIAAHDGKLEAVYNCKKTRTGEFDASTCVQDVERGLMTEIQPSPWQCDTSNGDWFYRAKDKYKSTADVLHELTDTVSKNGNLLLNIVLKLDGTLPPKSKELLDGPSAWMAVNSESIFGTRPWVVYGEGPTSVAGGAFKEQSPFTAQDIRFTTKAGVLYAFCLGVPKDAISIRALAKNNPNSVKSITGISLPGSSEKIDWQQGDDALVIQPARSWPTADEVVFKTEGALPSSR